MKYGKLVNGVLGRVPAVVKWTDEHGEVHDVHNPNEEKLKELGYLPVTYTDPPADVQEGKHYEPDWEQTETEILQVWYLVDDPVYPEYIPEPTMSDLMDAVERGLTT